MEKGENQILSSEIDITQIIQNLQNNQLPQFQSFSQLDAIPNIDGFNPDILNSQLDTIIDGPKKIKQKKPFLHYHITDLYKLKKIKYTLEFEDPLSKKQMTRGQYIYTLERKEDQYIEDLLQKAIQDGHKKVYIDIGFHFRQFLVNEIWELSKNEIGVGYKKERKIQIPEESQTYGTMPSIQENLKASFHSIPNADLKLVQQSNFKQWYLTPKMQAKFYQSCLTSNWQTDSSINSNVHISKDLNTLEFLQKELHYYIKQDEQDNQFLSQSQDIFNLYSVVGKKPELHLKFMTLKLKKITAKNVLEQQLKKNLKILLIVGQYNGIDGQILGKNEFLSDFGIKAINYKQKNLIQSQNIGNIQNQNEVYLITQDSHESSQMWLPQIYSTTREPIQWSMNYLVPASAQLVSSGKFYKKQIVQTKDLKEKMLYVYKIKNEENLNLVIPDKIGFILGNFQNISIIKQNCTSEAQKDKKFILGSAFFVSQEKQLLFEANNFYNQHIIESMDLLENIIKNKHPSISINSENSKIQQQQNGRDLLKIIFLPNLFISKQAKQSINFSDCIHVFDEEYILLPRNVIEKRHRIYKTLASSLAYDFFGNKIIEEEAIDQWLFVGIREHIGEIFRRQKCGQSLYKYHMIKKMDKFFEAVSSGAERFSLTSQYVSHFSEIEYEDNLYYWKSQMIMHIMEKILGETHFFNVIRDFYKISKPFANIQSFKKVLPFGIKFTDIQKNWIDSTGCPLLICSSTFNRRNTQVNIVVEQHSAIKPILKLKQHIQQNINQIQNICANGKILKDVLFNRLYDNQEPLNLNESYQVEKQREAKQWISYDVKVVVYQTDGREIHEQSQKVKLRPPTTKVQTNMTLQCRPTRGIAKKNTRNLLMEDVNMAVQNQQDNINQRRREEKESFQNDNKEGQLQKSYTSRNIQSTRLAAEQLHQIMNDNNQWRFDMSDHEYEEYDNVYETKNLFLKNDCPILWIRVDPEIETIRRVKVIQQKKNWLFQLIKEKDYIGQIEACKELKKYNDQVVYDILQSVVKNEKYFFKVRKHALKSLLAINVAEFNQNLSREKFFLIKFFNQRNFNDKIGFYKSNDFKNILDYYINTYLIRSMAKSKEKKLQLKSDAKKIIQESFKNLQKCLNITGLNIQNIQPQVNSEIMNAAQVYNEQGQSSVVTANIQFQQAQRVSDKEKDKMVIQDEKSFQSIDFFDLNDVSSVTSKKISEILIKLIKENDNSENPFDDCFFISKLLANLGKLDDFSVMPDIAKEAEKQFSLDNIGKYSSQFSISKGAVKCLFNIKKQIYRFKYFKKPLIENMYQQHKSIQTLNEIEIIDQQILKIEQEIFNQFENKLESKMYNIDSPMELRSFIFEKQIKNMFFFSYPPITQNEKISVPSQFLNPLYHILKKIENSMKNLEFNFAEVQLQILGQFLEKYFIDKLNFKECIIDNDLKCKVIANILFYMITLQPISILDKKIGVWAKRIFNQIFMGSSLPIPLKFEQSQLNILEQPYQLFLNPQAQLVIKLSPEWLQTENLQQQQKQLEEQQEMKNQQQNNQLQQLPFRQQIDKVGLDNSLMIGVDQFAAQANIGLLNVANIDPISQINQIQLGGIKGQTEILLPSQNDQILFMQNYQQLLTQSQLKSADDINIDLTGLNNQSYQDLLNQNIAQNQENLSVFGMGANNESQIKSSTINMNQLLNIGQDYQNQYQPNIQKLLKEQQLQNHLKSNMELNNQDFNQSIIKIDILGNQNKNDNDEAMNPSFEIGQMQTNQDSQIIEDQQKNYKRVTFDQWYEHHQQVVPDEDSNADVGLEYGEEIDDFEDYTFTEIWKQKCWDILYLLYFDTDSGPFMSEFTREALGEIYSDYMDQIKQPINFQMIKQKLIRHEYKMPVEFIRDMNLAFDNCIEFNMEGSLYYKHAKKLKKKLQAQIKIKGLMEHQREIFNKR